MIKPRSVLFSCINCGNTPLRSKKGFFVEKYNNSEEQNSSAPRQNDCKDSSKFLNNIYRSGFEKARCKIRHFSTFSKKEVRHFDRLSDEIWNDNENSPFYTLHKFNCFRLNFILKHIESSPAYCKILKNFNENIGNDNTEKRSIYEDTNESDLPSDTLKGLKILDVGCGGGILSESLAKLGASVTGIDPSFRSIKIAEKHLLENSNYLRNLITYKNCDISCIKFIDNYKDVTHNNKVENNLTNSTHDNNVKGFKDFYYSFDDTDSNIKNDILSETDDKISITLPKFDVVVCSEVIEHVEDIELFLNCVFDAVTSKGTVIFSTFNKTLESYLLGIFMAEVVLRILPAGTHNWCKFVNPEKLIEIAKKNKAYNLETYGFLYIPVLNTFLRDPFHRVQYLISFRKF